MRECLRRGKTEALSERERERERERDEREREIFFIQGVIPACKFFFLKTVSLLSGNFILLITNSNVEG